MENRNIQVVRHCLIIINRAISQNSRQLAARKWFADKGGQKFSAYFLIAVITGKKQSKLENFLAVYGRRHAENLLEILNFVIKKRMGSSAVPLILKTKKALENFGIKIIKNSSSPNCSHRQTENSGKTYFFPILYPLST